MACLMQYCKAKRKKQNQRRKGDAMKRTMTTIGALIATVTPALASGGPETAGSGLLVGLFIAFGILIVLCQMVPAAVLFASVIRTLFGTTKKSVPVTGR